MPENETPAQEGELLQLLIANKILQAQEASVIARARISEEFEARDQSTLAKNIAENCWNEVYAILAKLWDDAGIYPGLRTSKLGIVMGAFNHYSTLPPALKEKKQDG